MPEQYKLNPETISKYDGMELKTEEDKRLFKKYMKLGRKITDNVITKLTGGNTSSPEFWGLREMLTEDEVDFSLRMKLRKWYYLEDLIELQKSQFNPARVKELIDSLEYYGK